VEVLKYNDRQLSIFDFEKSRASRQRFLSNLRDALGLEIESNTKKMLDECLKNPAMLSLNSRHFLYDVAIIFFDGKDLTERQTRYLSTLYRLCTTKNH